MKKLLFLVIIIILFAFPTTALANSAFWQEPEPYDNYVLIDDYSQIASAALFGHDKDNIYRLIQEITSPSGTKVPNQRVENFNIYKGKFKDFQVVITFKDGETANSNFTRIVEWGEYIYSAKDNTLKEGRITTLKPEGLSPVAIGIRLISPLLFTVLVEWLVSLAFRLKPGKYVVIINFISNPLMNILLLLILMYVAVDYYLALMILEALVAGAEFCYYTRKYKGFSKNRLLLFTVTANLTSWFLYWFFSSNIHLCAISMQF